MEEVIQLIEYFIYEYKDNEEPNDNDDTRYRLKKGL